MLTSAFWWQSAQDVFRLPTFSLHNSSPSNTANMPGLAVSSRCIACDSRLMSSNPDRRGSRVWAAAITVETATAQSSIQMKATEGIIRR
ncbi:hypothetical protein [Neorhizobium galegae]|uniref:hypothetical protein n=1 Tax=Neorhizobium galegae TaxID=399 RepID=UPI00351EABF8